MTLPPTRSCTLHIPTIERLCSCSCSSETSWSNSDLYSDGTNRDGRSFPTMSAQPACAAEANTIATAIVAQLMPHTRRLLIMESSLCRRLITGVIVLRRRQPGIAIRFTEARKAVASATDDLPRSRLHRPLSVLDI